jgi:hypothetical protein
MAARRVLLTLSVTLLPINGVVGIETSGFDRNHAPKHDTKRPKQTIQQSRVTLLVDRRANALHGVDVTTTGKHDSQIAASLMKRNAGTVAPLPGDKGYGDQMGRAFARDAGVRPLIEHREFSPLHEPWNARLHADFCGQRCQHETVNSSLKRRYGAFVRSRDWRNSPVNSSSAVPLATSTSHSEQRVSDNETATWVRPFRFSSEES